MNRTVSALAGVCLAALLGGCPEKKESAGEKAARMVNETVDKIRHGDEGTLEKAGRKMDEAIEEAKKELEDAG